MKSSVKSATLCVFVVISLGLVTAVAQNSRSVIQASHHDVSPPLSQLVGSGAVPPQPLEAEPVRPTRPLPGSDLPVREDSALQTLPLPLVSTSAGLSFDGVSANGYAPPDTNGSA